MTSDTETSACVHVLLRGPRRGMTCDEPVILVDRCQTHLLLTEINEELGTCKYQFTRGDRKDLFCPGTAINDGYCEKHAMISSDDETPHCSHVFKGGYRKGFHCTNPPLDDGTCYSHSWDKDSLPEPKLIPRKVRTPLSDDSAAAAAEEPEVETVMVMSCGYQFAKGDKKGLYCPRFSKGDTGFCYTHLPRPSKSTSVKTTSKKTASSKTTTKSSSDKVQCSHILLAGPNKGQQCSKWAYNNETGTCNPHSKFANRCTHIIVIEVRCKNPASCDGLCHKHVEGGKDEIDDPEYVEEEDDDNNKDEDYVEETAEDEE